MSLTTKKMSVSTRNNSGTRNSVVGIGNIQTPTLSTWKTITVYGSDFTPELKMMADTITKLELWEWLRNYSPDKGKGFMWSSDKNIKKISNALPQNNHSGATFAYAMRQMEFIAKNGFDEWNKKTK